MSGPTDPHDARIRRPRHRPSAPSEQPGTGGAPDDADPTPSEFLTPVHPYETIEPDRGATWPGSAAPPASAPPRRRGTGIGAAVVAVVLVAAALVWVVSDRSSSGPLEAPADLTATAEACAAPDCERQQAIVTLRWSQVDDDVDVVEILRSGRVMEVVEPDVTTREIVGLRLDHPYVFGVRAVLGNESGPASTVKVRTPVPPLREAQLAGTYRVRERVRSATNLSSVEGIANPRPGSTTVNTWTFEALCDDQAGACPARWFTWGPLRDDGRPIRRRVPERTRQLRRWRTGPDHDADASRRALGPNDPGAVARRPIPRHDARRLRLSGRRAVHGSPAGRRASARLNARPAARRARPADGRGSRSTGGRLGLSAVGRAHGRARYGPATGRGATETWAGSESSWRTDRRARRSRAGCCARSWSARASRSPARSSRCRS